MRNDPVASLGETADWQSQMKLNAQSLVNYATAPIGAKKFEGSSLSR